MTRPSIYEFAGGEDAFLALAAAHHQRCLDDPELNHPFSQGVNPAHIENLASYWAEVFGGPALYSESLGGHSAMLSIHTGKGAGHEYGPRFVECFTRAADDVGLPEDPDFRAALRAYMEWAVADVLQYSPQGTVAPSALIVPRWSWDGLRRTQLDERARR